MGRLRAAGANGQYVYYATGHMSNIIVKYEWLGSGAGQTAAAQRPTPLPFRRIEVVPGEEAQVDFGRGASVSMPDGKVRRPTRHVPRLWRR